MRVPRAPVGATDIYAVALSDSQGTVKTGKYTLGMRKVSTLGTMAFALGALALLAACPGPKTPSGPPPEYEDPPPPSWLNDAAAAPPEAPPASPGEPGEPPADGGVPST